MKRLAITTLAGLVIVAAAAGDACALAFSVDVPVQFTLADKYLDSNKTAKAKERTTNDVNGFLVGVSAGWLGLGYERYDVKLKGKAGSSFDLTLSYQFYDIFLDLPVPVIHPVIGYGKGVLNTDIENSQSTTRIEATDAAQYFARLGLALGPLWDVHLGYHKITATDTKIKDAFISGNKFKGSGETYTLGVRLGW